MGGKRSRGPRSYRPVWFYFSNFPQYEFGHYGEAFLEAARTLMRSLRRKRGFSNVSVAPLLFTYRHAIELFMKAIIVGADRPLAATEDEDTQLFGELAGHELSRLLPRVRSTFDAAGWEWWWPKNQYVETFDDVAALLKYIETIDPRSFSFRYPIDKRRRRSIAKDVEIPFEVLVAAIDALAEALHVADFGLTAERSR
jgi:hypothetical protein